MSPLPASRIRPMAMAMAASAHISHFIRGPLSIVPRGEGGHRSPIPRDGASCSSSGAALRGEAALHGRGASGTRRARAGRRYRRGGSTQRDSADSRRPRPGYPMRPMCWPERPQLGQPSREYPRMADLRAIPPPGRPPPGVRQRFAARRGRFAIPVLLVDVFLASVLSVCPAGRPARRGAPLNFRPATPERGLREPLPFAIRWRRVALSMHRARRH